MQTYDTRFGKISLPPTVVAFLNQHRASLKPALIGLVVLLVLLRLFRRRRD